MKLKGVSLHERIYRKLKPKRTINGVCFLIDMSGYLDINNKKVRRTFSIMYLGKLVDVTRYLYEKEFGSIKGKAIIKNKDLCDNEYCVAPKHHQVAYTVSKKSISFMKSLRAKGFTYKSIGEMCGITKQRAHSILRGLE